MSPKVTAPTGFLVLGLLLGVLALLAPTDRAAIAGMPLRPAFQVAGSPTPPLTSTPTPTATPGPDLTWYRGVDATLDTALAVGLAGVALTGAIFLIGFASPIQAEINRQVSKNEQAIKDGDYDSTTAAGMRKDTENALAKDRALVKKLRHAAGVLVWSFYAFVFLLLDTLLLDHTVFPISSESVLSESDVQEWLWIADLLLSGLPALVGIILLVYGAFVMKGTLINELVPANSPPQAPTTDMNSNPTGKMS
jgi:hypothetical protein